MKWAKIRPYMLLDWNHWKRFVYSRRDSLWPKTDWEALLDSYVPLRISGALRRSVSTHNDMPPLRILYVAPKYDYGDPRRGLSFEEGNFFGTLWHLGHEILHFDYLDLIRRLGRPKMNQILLEAAYRYAPDLMFVVLFEEEFDTDLIREISTQSSPVTLNWFCDDQWRFEEYARRWAPMFNWVVTTVKSCVGRYHEIGYRNVIHAQWACNHFLYRRLILPMRYDVSFVGQPHGNRGKIIDKLRKAGISVHTWGHGWRAGRVAQMEMVKIFNSSRINLNLSNSSVLGPNQIKGRDFEVPGCGGFLITGWGDEIQEYFDVGKEIVCYHDVDELVELVRHYLKDEEGRRRIAEAGYERTLRDHTYESRFHEIFKIIGLSGPAEGCERA